MQGKIRWNLESYAWNIELSCFLKFPLIKTHKFQFMCDYINLFHGICVLSVQGNSLQTAGTQSFPLSSVSPLTSQTQLMEKLPVHTKSILSALWRHLQRKLSTPPPRLVNRALFFKGKKGKAEEIPKTTHNVWEKEAGHINLKLS